jgi:glycosidase
VPVAVLLAGLQGVLASAAPPDPKAWQEEAVWYQIFPERFRNGDASNDPVRDSLGAKQWAPASWRPRAWTSDWYARDAWEQVRGEDFYRHGVGERRYGGDIQGIIDKLDYLKDLGITAIYLNPVFWSGSHHKYDAFSFHHVDPWFGPDPQGDLALMAGETEDPATWRWSSADKLFLRLLAEARARGIRVIIDGVFNHGGLGLFAFEDVRRNQQASRYRDWFVVDSWDDPSTPESEFTWRGWHGIKELPEFAEVAEGGGDLVPGVKDYLLAVTRRWMAPDGDVTRGVDGWRLDVAWMVPGGFWRDWNALVHSINPAAITITEIWKDAHEVTLGGHFDATMNYEGFAMPVKGWLFDGALAPSGFAAWLDRTRGTWPEATARRLQNLLDSHDTPRAASAAHDGRPGKRYVKPGEFDLAVNASVSPRENPGYRWQKPDGRAWRVLRMAVVLQMTYVGTPFIYYGTEAGMWGGNDPDCRKPMVWEDLDHDAEFIGPDGRRVGPHEVKFDRDLHSFFRAAIALRRGTPVLSRGDLRWLMADDAANTLAFLRQVAAARVVAVFNRSDASRTLRFAAPEGWPDGLRSAVFVSDGSPVQIRREGAELVCDLPALTAAVFLP